MDGVALGGRIRAHGRGHAAGEVGAGARGKRQRGGQALIYIISIVLCRTVCRIVNFIYVTSMYECSIKISRVAPSDPRWLPPPSLDPSTRLYSRKMGRSWGV